MASTSTSTRSKRRCTTSNILNYIDGNSDEDIGLDCSSSEDEYIPITEGNAHYSSTDSDSDSSEDNITLAVLAGQSRNKETSDSDEDISLADLSRLATQQSKKKQPKTFSWKKTTFNPPDTSFTGTLEPPPPDGKIESPYTYFRRLITCEMLDNAEQQTNIYSVQKEGTSLNTTKKEIEIFIGIYLRMGLVKMPTVRSYWEAATRYGPIADQMNRKRFEKLASTIHFTNNLLVTDEEKGDKLWKIRPWLKDLRDNFLSIPPEENHAVDEIMVSFKGKSALKQYIRGKPHPWGFKMWGRAGSSGILYDFDVYQGKYGAKSENSIGVGGDVVLKLTETLPSGKNYKIFADNFFTSMALVEELSKRSLPFIGTVRANRLKNCSLKSEKELRKEGRGSSDYKIETSSNLVAVRWYDNKTVDIVSSYQGIEPVRKVKRWDKASKTYVQIDRPAIIETYNSFMGGVDLMDSLTGLYKSKMKTRRWYMYLFWHTILLGVVNAWLWYKCHCKSLKEKPSQAIRVYI